MASDGSSKAYVVLVKGQLKPGHINIFLDLFRPLAEYVEANEQGAHSYQVSVGDNDPDSILIFERYIGKEYLETVHWLSPAFKEFQSKVREAGIEWVEKSVTKYIETDIGYMTRRT